jgi:hypothetical protein
MPCCTNFNLLDIAYQAAESTGSAVSTTSRATLMPSGVMRLCKFGHRPSHHLTNNRYVGTLFHPSFSFYFFRHHMGDV